MIRFLIALQYMTIIPVTIKRNFDDEDLAKSQVYFPLVGFLLGSLLAGFYYLFCFVFSFEIANILIITLLVVLTGGLHLDGLADTLDGLGSGKSKIEKLAIMKDSHIGTMGVIGIFFVLLLKIGFLYSIPHELKAITLILLPTVARWSISLPCLFFNYAQKDGGKGKPFIEGINIKIFSISTTITLLITFSLFYLKGVLLILIISFFAFIIGKYLDLRLGGLTGDTLGFIIEIEEVLALAIIFLLVR